MPHPTKSTAPSEADLAVNRALLAHAELQRNLKRLLGPADSGDKGRAPDEAGDTALGERGSDDEFVAEDETAGLTLAPPTSTQIAQSKAQQNDTTLRRQLLGKRARDRDRGRNGDGGLKASKPLPRHVSATTADLSDEDDDEGRSGLGMTGGRRAPLAMARGDAGGADGGRSDAPAITSTGLRPMTGGAGAIKKRPGSYLDEILAERAAKKKKKKGKEEKTAEANGQ